MQMDQDQLSAVIVALIAASCIVGICVQHIRERNAAYADDHLMISDV